MFEYLPFLILGLTALIGFMVAGVVGFGGGIIIMPILVWVIGPREAVPVISVVSFIAGLSRTALNWKSIEWKIVLWSCLGAIPLIAVASYLYVITPLYVLTKILGLLLILFVLYRHTHWSNNVKLGVRGFFWVGAGTSFIDGFLGTVGPLRSPFLLTYGLSGGAYIGTAGMIVLLTQVPKIIVFGGSGLLETEYLVIAGSLGLIGFIASYLGRLVIRNLSPKTFGILVEIMLCASGILLLFRA